MPAASLPPVRVDSVERPRLAQRFADLLSKRLVLIEAPAGFGKTTLLGQLAQHLAAKGEEVSWISARTHSAAEIERTIASQSVQSSSPSGRGRSRYLFVDDAELLRNQPVLERLATLPERLTASRLVVATRTPLPLGTARCRGRGELGELHASDLAFDSEETRRFLTRLSGCEPDEDQLGCMVEQTHGWPTAIRLLTSPEGHCAVAEFLEEEVLAALDPSQRAALELLAIPERICPSLAAELARDGRDGHSLLNEAVANGLFLFTLDAQSRWFGIHPLLRDYLRRELAERQPARKRALHGNAAKWFELAGLFPEALDHAMRADDPETAARIFDLHSEDFYSAGLEQSILPCASLLPAATRARSPRILMAMSWRLQAELQLDRSRELLCAARARIDEMAATGACQPEDLRWFENQFLHRLITQAQCEGDFEFVEKHAENLLRRYPDASSYVRCSLYAALLQAQREQYKLGQLMRLEALARAQLEQVTSRYVEVFLDALAAPSRLVCGRIDALIDGLTRSLALACRIGGERSALGAVVGLPLAEAWLERNEVSRARALLEDYLPNATQAGFEDQLISGWLTDAKLRWDTGDTAGALARLDETIAFASARGLQRLRVAAVACAIELHCELGDRDAAASLASAIGLKQLTPPPMPEKRLTRTDGVRAMAWTRLAATRGHHDEALALARRWRARLSAAGAVRDRVRWEVRIAMLQLATGDERGARRSIHQALIAGAPGRLIRPFVEDAELTARLLPVPPASQAAQDFQWRFVSEVRKAVQTTAGIQEPSAPQMLSGSVAVDGLSQREVEILRLVAAGLLNGEIGHQLGLTEGSVKWYLQRIFDKVGTRRRMLAVDYARRRGLL